MTVAAADPESPVRAGHHRAAAYVRMSTQRQDLSISRQLDDIGRYATAHGFELTKIYQDEGRSGLSLKRRDALVRLLADIANGCPGFDVLLVHDVSRWGRFQDLDESAFYEHQCTRAGVQVVYCGEAFAGNEAPMAHVMKDVKRLMAAEYSRELSHKVFATHAHMVQLGYKAGGAAGFGLRRACITPDGTMRCILKAGERKSFAGDHVVLMPGPQHEVDTVRRIYRLYIEEYLNPGAIARLLNAEGVAAAGGGSWSEARVNAVLQNEKYCGHLLYNRTTARLGTKRRKNAEAQWCRHRAAHAPIVSEAMFERARAVGTLRRGGDPVTVLRRLRALYLQHGRLSYRLIDGEPGMPHSAMVAKMFGSLRQAYMLAVPAFAGGAQRGNADFDVRARHRDLCAEVARLIAEAGHRVEVTRLPSVLRLDGVLTVRIALLRVGDKMGRLGWRIPARAAATDFVLGGLLEADGGKIFRYVLLDAQRYQQRELWLPCDRGADQRLCLFRTLGSVFGRGADASVPRCAKRRC